MARRKKRGPEEGTIGATTHDGRGIVDGEGKKVFVAGALSGERVRYQRRKIRRNYDEAELLEVLEPSGERIEPKCDAFGRCGGCSLQHIDPAQQRAIKFQALKDNLQRIGNIEPAEWLEPMTGPEWHYRRRARLAVKDVPAKGRVLVGFRERHAPFITDMHRCEVIVEPVDELLDPLSELIGGLSIRARLPQVEVAAADNALALVFRVLDPPSAQDLEAFERFAERHDLRIYLQEGGLDSVRPLAPYDSPLAYRLDDFDVDIAFEPVDFVQINAEINERMVRTAIDRLDVSESDRVLDLYCGIGNFSLPLARRAGSMLGIEGEESLVRRARVNAERNGISNAEFACVDLAKIDGSESWLKKGCDRLLLDPARSGAAEVVERIDRLAPERIVYVSCHPGTLARDAGILVNQHGFKCEAAGIIDMFPHTAHVESIAVFSK
ncbi:MAG: 23S rRNA (uracil(1939)-C(5))-methyltransferase RlmD [Woeseiaceae bacterium]|nr:23S rRNA (uracil(1939)-C(5))-methyltransferase RlmD [Woeseiaceae bacterium]